ncbi:MAG: transpeptidase family protein [Saprospiraceae bacterium]|nr:transpeptidase family protein [Saprospiraceae bacterium]MCF8250579.1 transpeptidase family protein [Saprospiraceae bacterium]MCF8281395.1 transpeptidase family protein [Bacteroidales bacterium]MCF8313102.1 transpeptidase family protein [Saprospiraceae bacterium]MCF8441534.1 transpeptidase family protein [Saprospiraceae bacterium]
MAFNVKNEVLIRVYVVLAAIVVVAIAIFTQAVKINVIEGEKWRSKGEDLYIKEVPMEAERGNILTEDGSMLATSMPFFDISWDPNSNAIDTAFWTTKSFDSLAYYLATYVNPSMTPGAMKEFLWRQKQTGKRFVPIKIDASQAEKERITSFPLFNLGQFKGGLIVVQKYNRERPFRLLANRTIGYVMGDSIKVGIEGAFHDKLQGEEGTQLMYRVGGGMWIPLENLSKIEPRAGQDVVTTLDVNLQDITEGALAKAMVRHQAESGVAILMDVKTGAIRAMANLGWTKEGQLWETYNHAIGSATEPGSTFKLASMLALLEDGLIDLNDSIDLEQGVTMYHDAELKDAYTHHYNRVSVKKAFGMSSNVGVSRMVDNAYSIKNKADRYIGRLQDFYLSQPTGIEIGGEPEPYIKRAYNNEDGWSGTTLPWMAIGYELTITPLQLLAFYNAVANDGVYVKPYLIREVQQYGETIKKFPVTEVKGRIASKKAIRQAQELLESVVDSTWGTAYALRTDAYNFAGKTGTAQLNYQRLKDKTKVGGYQASFAGYFPAENPVYSCIVLITKPKEAGIYGGAVALPVFREIADKAISTRLELYPVLNAGDKVALESNQMPDKDAGYRTDIQYVMSELGLDYFNKANGDWASLRSAAPDSLKLLNRSVEDKKVPNVIGMGLRDALFLLENKGLKVQFSGGYGKVVTQSITPGSRAAGQTVYLRLG